MRILKKYLILLSAFFIPTLAFAYSPPIENGIIWLSANQNPDGGWSSDAALTILDTSTVLDALRSFDISGFTYSDGVTWLNSQYPSSTDFISRKILSLYTAGVNISADLSTVINRINSDGGWGGEVDSESVIIDTALALQALKKVNYSDLDTIGYAFSYLIDNQNPDGGFGFYPGDESNVYMTALVLQGFSSYNGIFDFRSEVNSAAAYLLTRQNTDGGFGTNDSTVYETALTAISLIESGQVTALPLQNAINYLLSAQQANGSWNDDPYSTALALRALANVKPNLTISSSDITFSKSVPAIGETITITVNVKNTGLAEADNVVVQFFDGDPAAGGILIGETTIPSIAANGSSQRSISWTVTTASAHTVFVQIDPLNSIKEINENDNIATTNLTSATLPDLSIVTADIDFNPASPQPDNPVTITVSVRNNGETGADNVTVDVYNGDPAAWGTLLGNAIIPSIDPGGASSAQIISSFTSGTHYVYAVIDRTNTVTEGNESNNTAVKILQIGTIAGEGIDVSVHYDDIVFSSDYPIQGDVITISAVIHNEGQAGANNILARLFLGDPDSGGTQIGSDVLIPDIPAGESAIINTSLNTAGLLGTQYVYIKLDPNNVIPELNEINNTAFKTVKIAAKTGTNLMVSNGEITFSPSSPVSGQTVTITAVIRNLSFVTANNVLVEFSDGDPTVVDSRIIGSVTLPSVSTSMYTPGIAQITFNTVGLSGDHDIYVNVDPLNTIAETDEKDNIARAILSIQQPQGADITVSSLDTANMITNTGDNSLSGFIRAVLENKGNQDTISPFTITVFEDRNGNEKFDPDTDNILAGYEYSGNLPVGAIEPVDINLSGSILFRDNTIYVFADSGGAINEIDETNNTGNTNRQCEIVRPVCDKFDVVEKFAWTGSNVFPSLKDVYGIPLVAQLTDDNGDGSINNADVPDIIFQTNSLRAVSGDDGHELFTVSNADYFIWPYTHIAAGDIDHDGVVEIAGFVNRWGPKVAVFENDGTVKWVSTPITVPSGTGAIDRMGVSIADIDSDGNPEIICGPNIINNDGTIRWSVNRNDAFPLAADLDLDGNQEIIIGNSAYRNDGTLYWTNSIINVDNIAHAAANLDDDPYPEIVQVRQYAQFDVWVYVFEHDGALKWGPVKMNSSGLPAPPTIADFDGDGKPEIGVSTMYRYTVLEADGSIKWQTIVYDGTYGGLGAAAFDFDGDGAAEIVHNDMQHLRILNGRNGTVIFSTPNSTRTFYDSTIVADVDNDNSAEIVVGANYGYTFNYKGIRVFENRCDNWSNTRKIWNEYNYHITNVNDDGTIPQHEQNNWEAYNNFRENLVIPKEASGTPDITVSLVAMDQASYPASVTISARIGNAGASAQPEGVSIGFYDGNPLQSGSLIGSAATLTTLNRGSFEDVSFIWNAPPSGSREIYVIADEGNNISECREDNNIASVSFDIGLGIQLQGPDLYISSSDISIIPSIPTEGQPAAVSAIIRNVGEADASNVNISFYDGDPLNGGTLIGTVNKPNIGIGAAATAEAVWNTFGQTGANFIYVIADSDGLIAESNENNNRALVRVEVSRPALPDLTINGAAFSDSNPNEGDLLTIAATVYNLGTAAGNIKVNLYDGDPGAGGALSASYTIATIIPFGGEEQVVFNIDTAGFSGSHDFYVIVDPENTIIEQNEGNNGISANLVVNSIGLNVGAAISKPQYIENEDALITVNMTDLQNESRELSADVKILEPSGVVIAALAAQPVTVSPLGTSSASFIWNTGNTLTGNYSAQATVYDLNSNPLARQSVPFGITSSKGVSANVVVDRTSYYPNEAVRITSTILNDSANKIFESLTASVSIADTSGNLLFTDGKSVSILAPSLWYSFNSFWNTSVYPPGNYAVSLKIKDAAGNVISSSAATLAISSETRPSKLLRGIISVDRQSLMQGEPITINYSITNTGNVDLPAVNLSALTVHVVSLSVYDTLNDQPSVLKGQTYANSQILNTDNYSAKDYLVILRANIAGVEETLASSYFRVEGAPSVPSLSAPANGIDVEALTPVLTVNNAADPNDDRLLYEFESYSDSSLTSLIASSGLITETTNTTSWQTPVELQENKVCYWRARVYDGLLYGNWMTPASFRVNLVNEPPTAPTASSPADNSEVDTLTPVLTVNNASDPDSGNLTYNFELSLDEAFAQLVSSTVGIFEGSGTTSWQAPMTLTENTRYFWRAQADDWLMDGPWMPAAGFFINTANDAPTAPSIVSPLNDTELTALYADITISNSADPDSAQLTYIFELDTLDTFDSINLVRSADMPEGQGTTPWHVEGLNDNTHYHIRAKASDGSAESLWSDVVTVFVNTVNDAPSIPVLANPSNGSGVNAFNPSLSVHNSSDIDGDVLIYEFEVYEDAAITNLVTNSIRITETPQITSWTIPVNLIENKAYYWRARAFDGELYSGWMPVATFMVNTANDAPTAPALQAPTEGSSLDTLTPSLSIYNSTDPDSDVLTYDFEIYSNGVLIQSITGIPQNASGVTSAALSTALSDNTIYNWRAKAYDGDRYGAWMDMAMFSIHLPVSNITATIDFDPNTLNKKSSGKWVTVYIKLPAGYNAADINVSSILLEGVVPAEPWPYSVGDYDRDGIPDLMVKFRRSDVINLLPNGDNVPVHVTGTVGTTTFEGFDVIRVIQ